MEDIGKHERSNDLPMHYTGGKHILVYIAMCYADQWRL